jgi:hypothetical protein
VVYVSHPVIFCGGTHSYAVPAPLKIIRNRQYSLKLWLEVKILGFEELNWIHLAQDRNRWRGCFEHGDETSGFTKGEKSD